METNSTKNYSRVDQHSSRSSNRDNKDVLASGEELADILEEEDLPKMFRQNQLPELVGLLKRLSSIAGKSSFLVFKDNKYLTIPTENIAFFFLKHESTMIMCFDKQEYLINHSLDQVQRLLNDKQFFRLNRQYLINFRVVKGAEHYFARKLFVHIIIPAPDKLVVSKEKVTIFLAWLENR